MRRALQRNTKLRRAPGALYARLPLRALRAEEVAEREPAAIPARPKPSHRAPGHAHFRERALGMRSARASIKYMAAVLSTPSKHAGVGTTHALYAQPPPQAQTGPEEQPDESTAAKN